MSVRRFPGQPESDAALLGTLKEWQPTRVFDAFFLHDFPPTFDNGQNFTPRANALIQEVGGRFIIATLPVGKEGWESSNNERLANRQMGTHFDATKAVTQLEWLETLKAVQADTWAWVLEQPARMPTSEQASLAAKEFVRFAKAQHKQTVLILSAQALTHGRSFVEMTKAICDATRTDADFFAWMDLPGESLQAGEHKWRETMAKVLDQILTMSPKEKTIIQWLNNPRWPTKDVEGTKTYIAVCQSKGINRFQVLFPAARHTRPRAVARILSNTSQVRRELNHWDISVWQNACCRAGIEPCARGDLRMSARRPCQDHVRGTITNASGSWKTRLFLRSVARRRRTARRPERWLAFTLMVVASCSLLLRMAAADEHTTRIYMVDVGHGNCVVVVGPSGQVMMLDTGAAAMAGRVLAFLEQNGLKRIDYLLLSHFENDHMGGAARLVEKIPVATIVDHGECVTYHKSDQWWKQRRGPWCREGVGKQIRRLLRQVPCRTREEPAISWSRPATACRWRACRSMSSVPAARSLPNHLPAVVSPTGPARTAIAGRTTTPRTASRSAWSCGLASSDSST